MTNSYDQQQNQSQNQSVSINVASSDPMLEQRIFGQVASAGRQLARMAEVMNILITQFADTIGATMTEEQQASIHAFQEMCRSIKQEKARHTAEYIMGQLDSLQVKDAVEYARLMGQLRARLDTDGVA